jgi:hypothetical protein
MTIFAIIKQPGRNSDKLAGAIERTYQQSNYELENGSWLVSDTATAKDVADKLGITDGVNGSGLVVEIASYYGYANPAVWSWMKTNWERTPSG